MKTTLKRLFSLFMVLALLGSMLPAVYADEPAEPVELTDADYAIVNDVFAQIDAMEDAPAKKSASRTQITDAAAEIVMASENYVEGSLERNGNSFTWWTDEGIRCIYNPYMREKYANMRAPENPEAAGVYNEPKATKGGWPSGNQVYLIAPYYGIDDTFTDQYKNEAKSIASAIGDTDGYTLYSGTSVTIEKVADAMESGAVVFFDSHGTTDYDGSYVCDDPDGYEVYDYVSKAKYSYLCLTNKSGLTDADYDDGAAYFTDSDGYMCACVNGAAIANHMDKQNPAGILWMAICLGMATDTFAVPMREMGVEVVYGYSQSVTFAGDYLYEETFWDNMIAGKNVATSIAAMKSEWGNWDWSEEIASASGYSGSGYTLAEARKYRSAFPIVVSDEDTHPGQRGTDTNYGACSEQTVKSTYTLFSQYDVTAKSNNTTYGTVSVSGNVITAKPATGYFAQGYTITSGTATVTQNGNSFTVMASSDCTVQINFAAKTVITVNFAGANVAPQSGYAGDAMSLPTAVAPEGYKFLGWTTAPLSSETTEKPTYYTDSFVPTGNTTLYALYSYVEESSDGGSGDYVKVTETPDDWSGEYLIVYEAGSRVFDGSRSTLEAVSNYRDVTINNNTISAEEADGYRFIIASMTGGYSVQSASGLYISGTSSSNKLNAGTAPAANTINIDASGNADIVSNTSHLRYNATSGQDRFRYYKSSSYSNQQPVALYVKDGTAGTTYYISTLCDHENTKSVAAVAATCTESGYTAGVQCADCGTYISGHEVIAALGHSWSAWNVITAPGCETAGQQTHTCSACGKTETQSVAATGHSYGAWQTTTAPTCTASGVQTSICSACGSSKTQSVAATGHDYEATVTPPTATEQGYTTYTCSVCGNSYTGEFVYTVRFSVPSGVAAVANMECGASGIKLPTAGVPTGDYEYTFVGWTTAKTDNTTDKPEILPAGTAYKASANVTLYALYTYKVVDGNGTADEYALYRGELTEGDYVIVYGSCAMVAADADSNTRIDNTTVTVSNSTIRNPDATIIWHIAPDGDYWTIYNAENGVYAAGNGSKNKATVVSKITDYGRWTPTGDGTYEFKNLGNTNKSVNAYLRYNAGIGFGCYSTSTGGALSLYKATSGSTTYYTTIVGEEAMVETWSISLGDNIGVNFVINGADTVSFTVAGEAVEAVQNGSTYSIYLAAAQMTDEIVISVNGETLEDTYSVRKYADAILSGDDDDAKNLVKAMLCYGGAAQTYFGYNTTNLASSGISSGTAVPTGDTALTVTDDVDGIDFYGASLVHENRIAVRFYFSVSEGMSFAEGTAVQKDDLYYIEVADINPYQIGGIISLTINGEDGSTLTVSYSPLTYIVRMYGKAGASAETKALVQALYNYYLAAVDYTN